MTAVLAVFLSAALAALLALAGHAATPVLALAVALVVVLVAIGWAVLMDLPDRRGTALVIALTGWVSVGAALLTRDALRPLAVFSGMIALAVLAAFGHELFRRGNRDRLVESVSGTLVGQVVALLGSGWVLVPEQVLDGTVIPIAATALGATRVLGLFPWPARLAGWIPFLAGTAAGVAVGVVLGQGWQAPVAVAGAVAAVVAGMDRMLAAQPTARTPRGGLAGASAATAAVGAVTLAAALLIG
ncbi:MAG: hypothetical protein P8Z68_02685 [Kineosporiaceae bacterium]